MIRTRICLYILLLTPLAVYWQDIFHSYGVRNDYANLQEARVESGVLVKSATAYGRPLYGALLETSFGVVEVVRHLPWLRLNSVLLLTLLGLALWRQLYQSGWTEVESAAIGLGIVLLPSAQVTVTWASGWPYALGLLLSVAGFSAVETELERGGLKRIVALLGGCLIYMLAGLVYQPNALFAVALIAAVLMMRTGRENLSDLSWSALHLLAMVVGLVGSYLLGQMLLANGVVAVTGQLHFETHPLAKLGWFFLHPLPNALGLFALRDDLGTGSWIFWGLATGAVILIGFGCRLDLRRDALKLKKRWWLCLGLLPFVASSFSLVAGDQVPAYRSLFALAALVLVLVVCGLRSLLTAGRIKPKRQYLLLTLLVLGAAVSAQRSSHGLIAEPQGAEWEIVRGAVARANFNRATKVYLITPTADERGTARIYGDEYGAPSSQSVETAQAMFHAALYGRFAGELPKEGSYTVAAGPVAPADGDYDLVIDLRQLQRWRTP